MTGDIDPARLPPRVREKYEQLARGKHAHFADLLLKKHAAATSDAERERVEQMMLSLGGGSLGALLRGLSSTRALFWKIAALAALMIALPLYLVHRHERAVAAGAPAVARVTRLEEGFCWFGGKKSECMELTVEVWPGVGAPYEATLTHDIGLEWMSRVQPGSYVKVAVDRADPKLVYLNEDALSEEAPKPPGG